MPGAHSSTFVHVATSIEVALPFDAAGLIWYLRIRAIPGVEIVGDDSYRRTVLLPHGPAVLALRFGDTGKIGVELTVSDPADVQPALIMCRRLLDADADPVVVDALLAADPHLSARVAAIPGIRVPGVIDGPEILIRTILGQQISVAAARTAAAKLTARADTALPTELAEPGLTRLFISPGELAALAYADIGGPRRRADTLLAAARDLADGSLVVDATRDQAELTAELIARPGIGPWTAGYLAMRVLGKRDELLIGDLALRNGARNLGLPSTPGALAVYGARWAPLRSYAGQHLWRAAYLPVGERVTSS